MDEFEYTEGTPLSDNPEEYIPEEPIDEAFSTPAESPEEPDTQTGAYHGAGVGQKESPFASSPYYTAQQTQQSDYDGPAWQPEQPAQAAKPHKVKKHHRGYNRRIVAAVAAVALMAGSCGVTAALVNHHWEQELNALEQSMEDRLNQLSPIQQTPNQSSVSGTVVSNGSLSPSQVYAMNVNSVVSITNYATSTTSNQYSYFFGGGSTQQQVMSTGSGFILSTDGYVITNYHVVEDAERLTVTTYAGDEYEASLVGGDSINDVALLKVEATGLSAVTIGSSDALNVGDQVVAIGNPLGELTSTQTVGYISGKGRSVTTDNTIINMLQTDAAINAGNSGGPLFNMNGEVVGITTAKYSGSASSGASIEGIGFAIPFDDVAGMIAELIQNGYISAPYMGIKVTTQTDGIGCYVYSIEANSPAAAAGLQAGDIIRAIGDYDVTSFSELDKALDHFKAGETTSIFVLRGRQILELTITFTEKNAPTGSTVPASSDLPNGGSAEDWFNYWKNYENQG